MYAHRATHGPVDLAFTDRYGGVSGVPFEELNLALVSEDDAADRAENLRRVLADFAPGARLADMHQVHGATVQMVQGPQGPQGPDGAGGREGTPPECDALVTADADVVLMVRVADCVPVLLADPDHGVIGAAHAGRSGVAAGVVPAAVERMRALGADRVTAWVGPHVCGACYEVPAALQEEVAAREPTTRSTTSWGTSALDLGAGVRAQLARAGVEVVDVSRCTRESADLYSHRRDGASAGRSAGLIRRRS
ncbi:peptidoglycan editing factor PgeF [Nocardioides donggukensis]|uniref:Purine nucleoside phosphorylase n=1 Tax=Nocardioides donggukensis TaxID=2774019 RepID=A0A927K3X5_9ACTN|nr:peptidoglycan editing factor PgeF [Nocardioides donggukensis]MBD8869223.1 peptidoglycan editing factor PgeF [Nocardioides donggukensis]